MAPRALAERETRQRRMLPSRSHNNNHINSDNDEEALPRQSLVITSTALSCSRRGIGANGCAIVLTLAALVCFWFVCFVVLVSPQQTGKGGGIRSGVTVTDVHGLTYERLEQAFHQHQEAQKQILLDLQPPHIVAKPHLVSRMPNKVVATADVRGNLGPATVVVQQTPGADWIHDRWQAASNMHGKQIPGAHWIQLEFQDTTVVADRIVLDWETAYADEYVLEASLEPIALNNETNDKVWVLFDGRKSQDVASMRSVTESGRSPGVKEKRPLHVVHEIRLAESQNSTSHNKPFRYLRLRILKSVTGWGVSLWQFDVYGVRSDELRTFLYK